jgi:hypothetical protein
MVDIQCHSNRKDKEFDDNFLTIYRYLNPVK